MTGVPLALEELGVLAVASFVPAVLYLAWVRREERFETQGWGSLLGTFAYGAIIATIVAAIVEGLLVAAGTAVSQAYPGPEFVFLNGTSSLGTFFLVLVLAPFVEEALKATGVTRAGSRIRVVSDGLVIGAAAGFGFGFFETFLYGVGAFVAGGLEAGLLLILVRSVSSVVLHGSTTSMFGYGYGTSRIRGTSGATGGYYLLAVAMHSGFNLLASAGAIVAYLGFGTTYSDLASLLALLLAVLYAFAAIGHARRVIRESDAQAASGFARGGRAPPDRRSPR